MAKRTNQPSVKKRREQMRQQEEARQRRTRLIGFGVLAVVLAVIGWFVFEALRPAPQAPPGMELSGERPLADLPPAERANYFSSYPETVIDPSKSYEAVIEMADGGEMRLALFDEEAPLAVNSFVFLANQGFYDGTTFHRVLEGFMAQGGDPTGTGAGGPGYEFQNETDSGLTFDRPGLLAMANAGPDTNGSQFFITYNEPSWLNGGYTIFGELIDGQEVLDGLTVRDPEQAPDFDGDEVARVVIVER